MECHRKPTEVELLLLQKLIAACEIPMAQDWTENLLVSEMEDGGMGSLKLYPSSSSADNRGPGRFASELQFPDSDGVNVIATLYIDITGQLYELDLWKTDFSRLNQIRLS